MVMTTAMVAPFSSRRSVSQSIWTMAVLVTANMVGLPAHAREPSTRDVAGWTVAVGKDGEGCFITRSYDRTGGTTLLLGLDPDGANRLSVLNAHWSIKPKAELKLDFRLSGGSYPKHFAVGIASDGKQGFVTSFEPQFPTYFATSRLLEITRGEIPVERLDLAGSGAAVAALRRCVAEQRAQAKGADRPDVRVDDIPVDPFAPSAKAKRKK